MYTPMFIICTFPPYLLGLITPAGKNRYPNWRTSIYTFLHGFARFFIHAQVHQCFFYLYISYFSSCKGESCRKHTNQSHENLHNQNKNDNTGCI